MLEKFRTFLIGQEYSEVTPSGKPSTVYDYEKRIKRICERENVSINEFANNIEYYVDQYGPDGKDADFGRKSHNAYISAIRKYAEYLDI